MSQERLDPLLSLAARFYGIHSALVQLGSNAPDHLHEEFAATGAKIEVNGGKVVEGKNVLGQVGPVVLDREGTPMNYELGRGTCERILGAI